MSYLAIDPGLDTGFAYFRSAQELLGCGLGDARTLASCGPLPIRTVLIEKPVVRDPRHSKGDPNDLITLAIQVGTYKQYFEAMGARVALVTPEGWKGQLPKGATEERARRSLSVTEARVVHEALKQVASSKQHNVWDAIYLGRMAFERHLWA